MVIAKITENGHVNERHPLVKDVNLSTLLNGARWDVTHKQVLFTNRKSHIGFRLV